MAEPYRAIAWIDAGQERLACDAAALEQLRFVAIGSTSGVAADVCRVLETERFSDLRHAVHRSGIDLLWLAGTDQVDREVLRLIREIGLPTFTTHPYPNALSDLPTGPEEAAVARFVPLMRRSFGCRAALEVLPDFGAVRTLNVSFRCGRGEGTLAARLYDAMDLGHRLCGHADLMDAAFAGVDGGAPDSLAEMRGNMTINARFSEGVCASFALSDGAGVWFRGVTILGQGGCIRMSDGGFEWIDHAGRLVDSTSENNLAPPGVLTAMHIVRAMDNLDSGEAPQTAEDHARLLALCEAARLSCRTGHGEAPRKVLEMLSRP